MLGTRSRGRKRVLVLDVDRPEVVAAYRAADLFMFGSLLECSPIVLFEAAAARTPFITTACGNAAEIASWTGSGVVVDSHIRADGTVRASPDLMASHIERLWHDGDERAAMAEAGYRAWTHKFTWERITEAYEDLYARVAGKAVSTAATADHRGRNNR